MLGTGSTPEMGGVGGAGPEGSGGAAVPRAVRYQGCRLMAFTSHSTLFQMTCTHKTTSVASALPVQTALSTRCNQ